MFRSLVQTQRHILRHPLCQEQRLAAVGRYLRWQIGSRVLPGAVQLPFVNDSRLVVARGMSGATMNIYTGIADFCDCGFLLHLLRPEDRFVDVGSNVGVYTVLAGAAAGARCVAAEPVPGTFEKLLANVRANGLMDRVETLNIGLGRSEETLRFTTGRDCKNHVVGDDEAAADVVCVPVRRLDSVLEASAPMLIKIDVEGYEPEVLAGAARTLERPSLLAIIVEMDSSTPVLDRKEVSVHSTLTGYGFMPYAYDPFGRGLKALPSKNLNSANTIYLRNPDRVADRVASAAPFRVLGRTI